MFQTELIVGDTTKVSLDLTDEIPISLNFNIADIRKPESRNGSYSKTINLWGTKTNNQFFEHLYEVNIVTNTFNPNIKTPCYVLQDGSEVFRGDLRLRSIEKLLINDIEEIKYEVEIYGDNKTLFAEIGDSKLEELDLSAYDHTYDRITQYNTWAATQGVGYCYPIIDYGFNSFSTNTFKVEWLRPAIYLKQYVDSIFAAAGKTYTSSFFNTSFFKSLIIPHNGDKFNMSASTQANYEFLVGMAGAGSVTNVPLTYGGSPFGWKAAFVSSNTGLFNCIWNDDTTSPFIDTGGNYNTTTGVFDVAISGRYSVSVNSNFDVKFNHSSAFTTISSYVGNLPVKIKILKRANSLAPWNLFSTIDTYFSLSTYTLSGTYTTVNLSWNNSPPNDLVCTAGEQMMVNLSFLAGNFLPGARYFNGATELTTGTASYDIRLASTATLKMSLSVANYVEGQTITINDAIPKDIKQKDLLTSVIKLFNLYVDIDKTNENNYLIEPRDDFYSGGTTLDWSDKLAWDKPFKIQPATNAMDFKKFIYKYKEDQDYFNKTYQDTYSKSYGQKTLNITNDFTKAENKAEVIFSPTLVVDNANNDLIIPKIFQYDGTNVKPQKHNIRLLMFNGAVTNTIGYTYEYSGTDALGTGNVVMNTYGQAAMVDDPLAPTETIEFGTPSEVFYTLPSTYTTNNLYNRFYYRFMSEVTDRDSKIITCYAYLEPIDIAKFDFRNIVYVKDAYYYVNKIMDYNPLSNELTKIELLKLKEYDSYAETTPNIGVIETDDGGTGMTNRIWGGSTISAISSNNVLIGSANRTGSEGSFISGDNNIVSNDSFRITLVSCDTTVVMSGCSGITMANCSGTDVQENCFNVNLNNCYDCTIETGVYDFVGINLFGETITSTDSGTVRIGSQAAPTISYATKTASFTVDPAIQLYYIDCTGGNITATFDISTCSGMVFYFKRLDASANTFSIDEITGLPLVDGNAIPYNTGMVQYDSITLGNNGTNFYIL